MSLSHKIIKQFIAFLLNCNINSDIVSQIGYTCDESEFSQYKLVIVPSDFFADSYYGLTQSMPTLPMKMLGETPVLFGKTDIVKINNTLVVYADIIASSYFLLSRYEELINNKRDEYGRFQEKNSVMNGMLHRPIVDEYGKLLRSWLRDCNIDIAEPPQKIKKIYLTHDIDIPYSYRTLRNLGGTFLKRKKEIIPALKTFFGKIENDPVFTFPYILEQNKRLQNELEIPVETIFFIKSKKYKEYYDKPYYNLQSKDIQYIISLINQSDSKIGLHTSYSAGNNAQLIVNEKKLLQNCVKQPIIYNRYHFLRTNNSQDMYYFLSAGITDDFSVGYTDTAGFRLGTTRPVNWINLKTKEFNNDITLHSLTIMDRTLTDKKYMNLNYELAFNYATELINQVKKHNGELVLLWHNQIFASTEKFNHKKFYSELLEYIKNI